MYLKQQGFSRKLIVSLKPLDNGILVNGERKYVDYLLKENDLLEINSQDKLNEIEPVEIPLDIIYEDEELLIINKQSDLPVHPSHDNQQHSLANAVLYYFEKNKINSSFHCINRLDRDTTGLTIIAKNRHCAALLSRQATNREIERLYLAIVDGKTEPSGTVDLPIGRENGIKRKIDEYGETAITHYQTLNYYPANNISLVQLKLETGRTHQIRVHMQAIGHPLVGDFLYNPGNKLMNRQALHASELTFTHPTTKEKMHFTAPLPDDMNNLLNDQ